MLGSILQLILAMTQHAVLWKMQEWKGCAHRGLPCPVDGNTALGPPRCSGTGQNSVIHQSPPARSHCLPTTILITLYLHEYVANHLHIETTGVGNCFSKDWVMEDNTISNENLSMTFFCCWCEVSLVLMPALCMENFSERRLVW